jgi:outer membrane cobalamin receptor
LEDERLKLTASIRYDKSELFDGFFSPRIGLGYNAGANQNHNIRASFQTGFRNPDTQSQFIWFPTSQGILVGSTEANAARYGLHNGGSYTSSSVSAYLAGGGSFDTSGNTIGGDPTLLQTATFGFVEPEQLTAFEIGYKGVIADQLLLDVNWYHNSYEDFIAQFTVFNKQPVVRADGAIATGVTGDVITGFRPYVNAQETITSDGIGVGLTYSIGGGYTITGNYNWTDFSLDDVDTGNELEAGFNTPEHRFGAGIHNRNVGKNIGFSLNYRWQDDFFWQSAFGKGLIPEFGVVDFQVNYKIKSLKSFIKLGSTNLLGGDYRTNIGPGFVGSQYYISISYDEFLH